jgi:hypothetical protein
MALKTIYKDESEIPGEYKELYSERGGQYELTGIEGIKTDADVARLNESLRKEREDHKKTREALRAWDGFDHGDIQSKLDRLEELEAVGGGKLDDAKINQIVEARLRSKLGPLEREKAKLTEQITAYQAQAKQRKIHDTVRAACVEAKVLESAIDDALTLAERVFDVDESGAVTVKDQMGFTPGSDAVAWLSELQPKRAHWWPASFGSGARDGKSGGFAQNPFSAEHWNLTEQGRIVATNPQRAEQMAAAAGVRVGAGRPKAKAA